MVFFGKFLCSFLNQNGDSSNNLKKIEQFCLSSIIKVIFLRENWLDFFHQSLYRKDYSCGGYHQKPISFDPRFGILIVQSIQEKPTIMTFLHIQGNLFAVTTGLIFSIGVWVETFALVQKDAIEKNCSFPWFCNLMVRNFKSVPLLLIPHEI